MDFLYRHTRNGMLQRFHSSFLLEIIGARSLGKETAKPYTITVPWTHLPVASKLEVAPLRQSRHDGELRLMELRNRSRCFAHFFS